MMNKFAAVVALGFLAACASNETETADLTATTEAKPVRTDTVTPGSQADLERYAGHRVFFGYDQHTLTPQAQNVLRKQAEWLNQNPNVRIQLEGSADERGTREYNLALGARRAQAARAYLVSLGVDGSRLSTLSHGKEKPIAFGDSEQAHAQNRNSTTVVTGASAS